MEVGEYAARVLSSSCWLQNKKLRKICKISGARVSFGTSNARDSFYRASVDFVLNICSRVVQPSVAVQIDGEDARQFISGLADNIGLEDTSAARIVRASVAARTRSCFLQSWPEMEMLASGLKKTLGLEQRKHLLTLFGEVCGSKCQRIAEEALGLKNQQINWLIGLIYVAKRRLLGMVLKQGCKLL